MRSHEIRVHERPRNVRKPTTIEHDPADLLPDDIGAEVEVFHEEELSLPQSSSAAGVRAPKIVTIPNENFYLH